jgi:hypothetical protein
VDFFDFVFARYLGNTKNCIKIMGQHLLYRESMHFFDFVFTHHLGITKNHMKIMGQHLVIISRSAALRDTPTLEEDPGVSEYLSKYILLRQSD